MHSELPGTLPKCGPRIILGEIFHCSARRWREESASPSYSTHQSVQRIASLEASRSLQFLRFLSQTPSPGECVLSKICECYSRTSDDSIVFSLREAINVPGIPSHSHGERKHRTPNVVSQRQQTKANSVQGYAATYLLHLGNGHEEMTGKTIPSLLMDSCLSFLLSVTFFCDKAVPRGAQVCIPRRRLLHRTADIHFEFPSLATHLSLV